MLAGVHDSFWTHACDVDQMNEILLDKFVELYSMPILENVSELRPISLQEIGSHKFRSFSGLFKSNLGGMTCI
ncbi:unnamed protein product [Prunus armeniaca]|uniref:DNA-directed RNA polymerase n=1 Tax=Prunus armeniaca TaxID=36596 RepID=A0A6J5VM45_PRUAR|nr:unnamed protein product [Prunus armeniaca]CAB4318763.1 unnamed protein product [Prunus armeniaca]